MLALRTNRGLARAECACGDAALDTFAAEGLVVETQGRVRATDRGYLLLNDLVLRLTEPPARPAGGYPAGQPSVPTC
jgi:hypothetical protein